MSTSATKKKPVGRPRTGKRPVIAIRVHNDLYEQIVQSAAARDLSISEESENRIKQSFEWDEKFGDARKMIADVHAMQARAVEATLSKADYQRVALDQGVVWAEPGMDISRMSVSIDAAAIVRLIEPELTGLVARALRQVAAAGKADEALKDRKE
jgi:hypothetical protein